MKRALVALLALCGLVQARRYAALQHELSRLETARRKWKDRADEAAARLRTLEKQSARQARQIKDLSRTADDGRETLEALQARLDDADRELATARDYLMVVEAKLDILEGAANVLDARTRAQVHRGTGESGAAV
jgi:chromosome segregation ATPase